MGHHGCPWVQLEPRPCASASGRLSPVGMDWREGSLKVVSLWEKGGETPLPTSERQQARSRQGWVAWSAKAREATWEAWGCFRWRKREGSVQKERRGDLTKQHGGRWPTPGLAASEIRATAEDSLQVCEGAHSADTRLLRTLENVFES